MRLPMDRRRPLPHPLARHFGAARSLPAGTSGVGAAREPGARRSDRRGRYETAGRDVRAVTLRLHTHGSDAQFWIAVLINRRGPSVFGLLSFLPRIFRRFLGHAKIDCCWPSYWFFVGLAAVA